MNCDNLQLQQAYPRLLPTLIATFLDHPALAYRLARKLLRNGVLDKTDPGGHQCMLEFWCERYLNRTATEAELQRFAAAEFAYYYREVPYREHLDYHNWLSIADERCPYINDPPVLVNGREVEVLPYHIRKFGSKLEPRKFWHLFRKELRILSLICHPHIHEYCGSFSIRDHAQYYFIFAKYDSTLEDVLGFESSSLNVTSLIQWMLDLSSALAYLHGLAILHRHISPRTIIFRGSQIYLSDIQFYSERPLESASKYDAPEICNNDPIVTRRSDIYSLGRVFLDLLARHCGVEITDETGIPLTEHDAFLSSVRHQLTPFQGQSLLLNFTDVILEMINWTSNRRPSAVQLHRKLITVIKENDIHNIHYMEITSDNYPDMSPEARLVRYRIFRYNDATLGLPWNLAAIKEDLVPGADELLTLEHRLKSEDFPEDIDFSKPVEFVPGKCLFPLVV